MFNFNKKRTDDILKGLREPTWEIPMNQEPTRECCGLCKQEYFYKSKVGIKKFSKSTCCSNKCSIENARKTKKVKERTMS